MRRPVLCWVPEVPTQAQPAGALRPTGATLQGQQYINLSGKAAFKFGIKGKYGVLDVRRLGCWGWGLWRGNGGEVFEMMQMEIQHECILYFYFFLFTSFLFVILYLFSSISQSIRKSFSHYSVGPVVPQSVMSVM